MLEMDIYEVDGKEYTALGMTLPKTKLIAITGDKGFIMCGGINIEVYDNAKRDVLAVRVVGVKTYDELLAAKVQSATASAYELGVKVGMPAKEALIIINS